jgi:hypothetical protein
MPQSLTPEIYNARNPRRSDNSPLRPDCPSQYLFTLL